MFTGIVEEVGRVLSARPDRLEIGCSLDELYLGDSVAVNGVCLTVAAATDQGFVAALSEETLARTTLGALVAGSPVNLERPVHAGGRLGGHVVQGHVDGVAVVRRVEPQRGSVEVWLEAPGELRKYLVEKGSVAVDGVSLTVARRSEGEFCVALIPHTLAATTFGAARAGDRVNLEVDILAKYVESLMGSMGHAQSDKGDNP